MKSPSPWASCKVTFRRQGASTKTLRTSSGSSALLDCGMYEVFIVNDSRQGIFPRTTVNCSNRVKDICRSVLLQRCDSSRIMGKAWTAASSSSLSSCSNMISRGCCAERRIMAWSAGYCMIQRLHWTSQDYM